MILELSEAPHVLVDVKMETCKELKRVKNTVNTTLLKGTNKCMRRCMEKKT